MVVPSEIEENEIVYKKLSVMNRKTDKTQLDRSSVSTDKCFLPSSSTNKGAADAYAKKSKLAEAINL